MAYPKVKKSPTAYIITVDGEVVEDLGKKGLINERDRAEWFKGFFERCYPDATVFLFGVFELTR